MVFDKKTWRQDNKFMTLSSSSFRRPLFHMNCSKGHFKSDVAGSMKSSQLSIERKKLSRQGSRANLESQAWEHFFTSLRSCRLLSGRHLFFLLHRYQFEREVRLKTI